jgi:hypothetical protein
MKCPYCQRIIQAGRGSGKTGKITDDDIGKIRERRARGEIVEAIAYDFSVSKSYVSSITRDLSTKRRRGTVGKSTSDPVVCK